MPNFALKMAIRDQRHANVNQQTTLLDGGDVAPPSKVARPRSRDW